ncbi:MAG: hypothetical protein ABIY37_14360 [Devosia sp.]
MAIRAASAIAVLMLSTAPVPATEINCEGVFNQNATLAEIEAAFGKDNVVTGEVPGTEGIPMIATTIYPNDPERTMQVRWWDEENVTYLAGVTLAPDDTGPGGVKVGMLIEEVQAINGEPFGLMGFFWDYGGNAGFQSGKLSGLPGECYLGLQFGPTLERLPPAIETAISGDIELRSDQPEVLAAKVAVSEVNLGYAYPEALGEGGETAE